MSKQRYRITVTPIETDGRQCSGRCTIEFEHRARDNWMRILEALQSSRDFRGDEGAAFTVGTQLLKDLATEAETHPHGALEKLLPELEALIERLPKSADSH